MIDRECDVCQRPYAAKTKRSRYCSPECNRRASRVGKSEKKSGGTLKLVMFGNPITPPSPDDADDQGLVGSTYRQLKSIGRLDTVAGQAAMFLARRLVASDSDTGSAIASLSREFREAMERALDGLASAHDPVNEIQERVAKKLALLE